MKRSKKLVLNMSASLIYQVVTIICGFILPKFIIPHFGSDINGLVSSIAQFLAIITLCECGIGAVVQSALYKPLADRDNDQISRVLISAKRFFGNVLKILLVYVAVMAIGYPLMIKEELGYFYISSLVLILSATYIIQHYLYISYKLLLNADQMSFVQLGAHTVMLVLNAVLTIILIKLNASIHIVKIGSAMAFLVQILLIKRYVDKHYTLNMKLTLTEEPIKQKWNGMAQHISAVVRQNVATIVLTLFASLKDISVYSVYFLIVNGIKQIIFSLTTGVSAMLGNMYAKKETETLQNTHATIVFVFHTVVTLLFVITAILIIPFVKIYTINFRDADYIYPLFGAVITLSQAAYCIRLPYEIMTQAAGHYKETQASSFLEAVICAVVSVICTILWGLVGVAIGKFVALMYRTVYLAWYLSKNILYRKMKFFYKHLFVDIISAVVMIVATCWIKLQSLTYVSFVIMAFEVGIICLIICVIINFVFYRKMIGDGVRFFLRRKKVN